jgi:hypothetical protein
VQQCTPTQHNNKKNKKKKEGALLNTSYKLLNLIFTCISVAYTGFLPVSDEKSKVHGISCGSHHCEVSRPGFRVCALSITYYFSQFNIALPNSHG